MLPEFVMRVDFLLADVHLWVESPSVGEIGDITKLLWIDCATGKSEASWAKHFRFPSKVRPEIVLILIDGQSFMTNWRSAVAIDRPKTRLLIDTVVLATSRPWCINITLIQSASVMNCASAGWLRVYLACGFQVTAGTATIFMVPWIFIDRHTIVVKTWIWQVVRTTPEE